MTSARMFKGQWADGPGWRKGTYERRSEKRLKSGSASWEEHRTGHPGKRILRSVLPLISF